MSESDCCSGLNCSDGSCDLLSFETVIPGGACGVLRNFRCSNNSSSACADDTDCDFGTCLIAPAICSGDLSTPCTDDADCQGTCEEKVLADHLPMDLDCGGAYTGGGLHSIPLPWEIPDRAKAFFKVTECNSGTGELTLGPTTPAEVGERHCTDAPTPLTISLR